ncbi:MAG: DUF3794 domain-containing protein [Bacillota bacterium]|nr:DUF3794 domain-containing protein [Bacillota bacterium]
MPNNQLDLVRRLLKVENVIGEMATQITVVNDVTFPERVKKIWDVIADIRDVTYQVIPDKVIVEGVVHKQIFWVQEGTNEVFEKTVEDSFVAHVDIPGARPGMNAQVESRVEFVTHDPVSNNHHHHHRDGDVEAQHHHGHHPTPTPTPTPSPVEDVWRQTVVLEVFVKVTETVQLEVITDVIAPPSLDLEVVRELLKVQSVVGEDSEQVSLVKEVQFPRRVKKIRDVTSRVEDISTTIVPDKVIVEGNLHKQIFYVEHDTGRLFEIGVDERFVAHVDIPGARPGMNTQVFVDVEHISHDLRDGSPQEGFAQARQTAILEVFVKVTEELQIEVVTDVIGQGVDVFRELLKVQAVVGEGERQITLRQDIEFDHPVKKIIDVVSNVEIIRRDTTVIRDKVIIEGVLRKQIFYVSATDDAIFEQSVEERFTGFVDIPGARPGHSLQVFPEVEFVTHDPIPGQPDRFRRQTAVIALFAKVTETVQIEVVVDVVLVVVPTPTPTPTPSPTPTPMPTVCPPSFTIYIVQRGDTLFKIAQRFGTTVNAILAANPQITNPDVINIGDQICVPRVHGKG